MFKPTCLSATSRTASARLHELAESLRQPDGHWMRHVMRDGHLWQLTLLLESRSGGLPARPAARQEVEELDLMDYFGGRAAE